MYTWEDSLSIGNELIDNQHKELLEAIGKLLQAMKEARGKDEMMDLVAFLEKYVEEHFSCEEKLQRESGYPRYKEHVEMHNEFRRRIEQIKQDLLAKGPSRVLAMALKDDLVKWMKSHIVVVDKELSRYLGTVK